MQATKFDAMTATFRDVIVTNLNTLARSPVPEDNPPFRTTNPPPSSETGRYIPASVLACWLHNCFCFNTAWVNKQNVRFVEENKTTHAIVPLDFAERDSTNGTVPRCLPSMPAVLFSTGVIPSAVPYARSNSLFFFIFIFQKLKVSDADSCVL